MQLQQLAHRIGALTTTSQGAAMDKRQLCASIRQTLERQWQQQPFDTNITRGYALHHYYEDQQLGITENELDLLLERHGTLNDAISLELMINPILVSSNLSYDYDALIAWTRGLREAGNPVVDPKTGALLRRYGFPNTTLRQLIHEILLDQLGISEVPNTHPELWNGNVVVDLYTGRIHNMYTDPTIVADVTAQMHQITLERTIASAEATAAMEATSLYQQQMDTSVRMIQCMEQWIPPVGSDLMLVNPAGESMEQHYVRMMVYEWIIGLSQLVCSNNMTLVLLLRLLNATRMALDDGAMHILSVQHREALDRILQAIRRRIILRQYAPETYRSIAQSLIDAYLKGDRIAHPLGAYLHNYLMEKQTAHRISQERHAVMPNNVHIQHWEQQRQMFASEVQRQLDEFRRLVRIATSKLTSEEHYEWSAWEA